MSVGVSRILVETRANAVILNLSGMLMKSNLIVTGLKTLEDVMDVCIGKVDWRKVVSVNGLVYHSKELELYHV